MQLELLAGRGEREHLVVQLLERRPRPEQPQAHAHARDVRVNRDVVQAVGEQQHTRGGLATDAGQRGEVVAGLLDRDIREPAQRQLAGRSRRRSPAGSPGCGPTSPSRSRPGGSPPRPPPAARRARPPTSRSARAGAGTRRHDCDRWCSARAPSGRARRSDRRAAPSAVSRTPPAGGHGFAVPARVSGVSKRSSASAHRIELARPRYISSPPCPP